MFKGRLLFLCHEPLELYKCHCCDFVTNQKVERLRHVCEKSEVINVKVELDLPSSAPKSSLVKNINSERSLLCTKCEFKTTSFEIFIDHQFRIHPIIKFECPSCDFKGYSKQNLEKHKRVQHDPFQFQRIYQCILCPFRTKDISVLQKHQH